jgi:hypothetical protein
LGDHQALDTFIALKEKQSDLIGERNKLLQFHTMQAEYNAKKRQTKIDFIEIEKITENYLNDIDEDTKKVRDFFRDLAKKLYPQSPSGITINVKKGGNQLAFTIEKQYIATVNQNQLNNLQKVLSPEEYDAIITNNTILTLTDESDAAKLLGIKVDIGNR